MVFEKIIHFLKKVVFYRKNFSNVSFIEYNIR